MARRVIDWIAQVMREPDVEPEVHFHSGPESQAAVCYDAHCRNPRLDVGAGRAVSPRAPRRRRPRAGPRR